MKAAPTLEGGLRLDAEDASDWGLLQGIITDATCEGPDLASRLGGMIAEESGGEDWRELVVPDLREAFQDELAQIGAAIESAVFAAGGGPGSIWISREDAYAWYSALNQARLTIEDQFQFGPGEDIVAAELKPIKRRRAFIRNMFYLGIQSCLLEFALR